MERGGGNGEGLADAQIELDGDGEPTGGIEEGGMRMTSQAPLFAWGGVSMDERR